MKKLSFLGVLVFISLSVIGIFKFTHFAPSATLSPKTAHAQIAKVRIPWIASPLKDQPEVAFSARTFAGSVFLTKRGSLRYALEKGSLDENFETSSALTPLGLEKSETTVSSFIGPDKSRWQSALPTFNSVSLGEVWPGISLAMNAYGSNIEKIFTVNPGSDPSTIRASFSKDASLTIQDNGELKVTTSYADLSLTKPVAYQIIEGEKKNVDVAYTVSGSSYGFSVGQYDHAYPLVIDPLLGSTFIGGSGYDHGDGIALDTAGNVYVTGSAYAGFPTTAGAYDETHNNNTSDVFVAKFNSTLTTLSAATFIGGPLASSYGMRIAVDASNNVYVTGPAGSGFPTTVGAYDETFNGGSDIFVAKLNSTLTTLSASTFIGGSGSDFVYGLVLDGSSNVYLAGAAQSGFPTTAGAYDETQNGGYDAFVAKLNSTLTTLSASTFIGGSLNDDAYAITLDASNNVYITGQAATGLPTTAGAYQQTYNDGGADAFVAKLNSTLTTLSASTFIGGSGGYDYANAIALDASNNVYITGYAETGFPATAGAYDETVNGGVFVSKFNSTLTTLSASTFLKATTWDDYGQGIAIDGSGNVVVTGYAWDPAFPTTSGAYDETPNGNYDCFVSKLNSTLTTLSVSTVIGSSGSQGEDECWGLAIASSTGDIYLVGQSKGAFPVIGGSYDTSANGSMDAVIVRFSSDLLFEAPTASDAGLNMTINSTATSSVVLNLPASPTSVPSFSQYKILYSTTTPVVTTATAYTSSTDPHLGSASFSGATTATISGLTPDTTYYFNLYAYNTSGSAVYKGSVEASAVTLTNVPTNVTITAPSTTTLTLSWDHAIGPFIIRDNDTGVTTTILDPSGVASTHLVGYWPMDEGSGSSVADWSGHNNNATFTGTSGWTTGQLSQAALFNGTSSYLIVPNSSVLEMGGTATFSAWINVQWNTPGYNPGILGMRTATSTRYSFHVGDHHSGDPINLGLYNGTTYLSAFNNSGFTKNAWHLWTVVLSGGVTQYYIDGQSYGSASIAPSSVTGLPFVIGDSGGGTEFFKGPIDDVRVYDVALTAGQIQTLYAADALSPASKTFTGVSCGPHSYSVGTFNSAGVVTYAAPVSATADVCTSSGPTTPTAFSGWPTGNSQVDLTWTGSDPTYLITNQTNNATSSVSTNSASITGLHCGSSYSFTVKGVNVAGDQSTSTDAISVRTGACPGGGTGTGGGGFTWNAFTSLLPAIVSTPTPTTTTSTTAEVAPPPTKQVVAPKFPPGALAALRSASSFRINGSTLSTRHLQQALNALGFTIASSGPGSPGKETTIFGAATRAALIRFQIANGIIKSAKSEGAGVFGPKTKAVLVKLLQ